MGRSEGTLGQRSVNETKSPVSATIINKKFQLQSPLVSFTFSISTAWPLFEKVVASAKKILSIFYCQERFHTKVQIQPFWHFPMTDSRTSKLEFELSSQEEEDKDEFTRVGEELVADDRLTPEQLYQAARALESDEDQERQFTVEILELLGMSNVEELFLALQTGYRRPPG
jgi:hypothetical protein